VQREDDITIHKFSREIIQFLEQKEKKSEDFLAYIQNNYACRNTQILDYFDEKSIKNCRICDVCLAKKRTKTTTISSKILSLLQHKNALSSQEINQLLKGKEKDILIHLRQLLADHKVQINHQNKYQLK
jgi:ATP-dependent DNA helicase RecQ